MTHDARFHFTKILVNDIESQFAFYASVLGMAEKYRYAHGTGDDALEEIIMTSAAGGDPTLVLVHFPNRPGQGPGEAILGFTVPDLDDTVRRVSEAGGTVEQVPFEVSDFKLRAAFVLDPEGHRLELVQSL
ncbi:VOC family protein [Streptomyces sp. NPDC057253]|uniref:VOC family protein n=1 Tax=Streptomyces sp. NPDC057253 TaxID=3346069 RepID=UPI00362FC0D1